MNYADNFIGMSKTESDALALNSSLWKAIVSHPAGPLKSNEPVEIRKPGTVFSFLGYALVPSDNERLTSRPADKAFKKWKTLMHDLIERVHTLAGKPEEQYETMERGWRSFQASVGNYVCWEGKTEYLEKAARRLFELAQQYELEGIELVL